MGDWFAGFLPLPDPAAHAAFRVQIQEALTVRGKAEVTMAALRVRAMRSPNVPLAPGDGLALKQAERIREDAMRMARVTADAHFAIGMPADDVATWEAAIRAGEAALSLAISRMEVAAQDATAGGWSAAAFEPDIGRAQVGIAWALCDFPIALRILRAGTELRTGALRA